MRKLATLFGLATVLALVVVEAASATPPSQFRFSVSYSDPHPISCGDFDIGINGSATGHGTLFFDADGTITRVEQHLSARDTLTNTVSGESIAVRGDFLIVFERVSSTETFTETVTGHVYLATEPGLGIVVQDSGRLVFASPAEETLLFSAGHHIGAEDTAFCPVLA